MGTPEGSRQIGDELNVVVNFLRKGIEAGFINNFTIDGPVKDEPTAFYDFICLYEGTIKAIAARNSSAIKLYDKILQLTFPERVRDLKISSVETLKKINRLTCSALKMPYIVVAFGQINSTNEEVISMFCVTGMSPEEAFTDVQDTVRKRKIRFN